MTTDTSKKKIRKLSGVVTSDKMDKTIVVEVERAKKHSKYLKIYKSHKKYKVHDPENKYKTGQKVEFVECRPISKDKKFNQIRIPGRVC